MIWGENPLFSETPKAEDFAMKFLSLPTAFAVSKAALSECLAWIREHFGGHVLRWAIK